MKTPANISYPQAFFEKQFESFLLQARKLIFGKEYANKVGLGLTQSLAVI